LFSAASSIPPGPGLAELSFEAGPSPAAALTLLREVRPLLSASEVGVALAATGSIFTFA
jgi:hypothetical protein